MIRSSRRSPTSNLNAAATSLLVLFLLGSVGCASLTNPRPSDAEIRKAIMARGAWNPIVGRLELQTVEIEQIGIFNSEKKYWPVKAKVKTAKTGETAVLNFPIFRDDYGQWAARPAERL